MNFVIREQRNFTCKCKIKCCNEHHNVHQMEKKISVL